MTLLHDGDLIQNDRLKRLVFSVSLHAGDGGDNGEAGLVALAEDGVFLIQMGGRHFGDEELRAVGAGPGVGHRHPSRYIEVEVGIKFIGKHVSRVAGSGARWIATLNHELRNNAMKGSSVIERLPCHFLFAYRIGPWLGSFGQAYKVSDRKRCLLIEKPAGNAAHAGIEDCRGTGGFDDRWDLAYGSIRQLGGRSLSRGSLSRGVWGGVDC